MSVYRTVFRIEVFSQGPFSLEGDDDGISDLALIDAAISDGDCIGGPVEQVSQEVVPDEEVHGHLVRIGNDGSFAEFLGVGAGDGDGADDPAPGDAGSG
jgi:hypothetical protein